MEEGEAVNLGFIDFMKLWMEREHFVNFSRKSSRPFDFAPHLEILVGFLGEVA